jgi:N4-gp56 family major capsid protein
MANNFIDVSNQAAIIATALDDVTILPFRPKYPFDGNAQAKRWNLNRMPRKGDNVQFLKLGGLSADTAALDTTATAINAGQKTVYTRASISMDAYGKYSTLDTLELGNESFIDASVDAAWQLADQAAASLDVLARAAFNGITGSSTYVLYGSNGTASNLGPLKSVDIRKAVTSLRSGSVPTFDDGYYHCILSFTQAQQLRAETGEAAWRVPSNRNNGAMEIYNGDIGVYEGVRFIASDQVSGAATNTIHAYLFGKEFVGKAVGFDPQVSMKPEMEGPHSNLAVIRWNALVGYGIIKRAAGRVIITDNDSL